jgi:hypothetical protein
MARKSETIGYVYRYRVIIGIFALFAIPGLLTFLYKNSPLQASVPEEPYSIFILAGQSNAEGSNAFRSQLPAGTGLGSQSHPADAGTGLWLAGADGKGPDDPESIINYFNGQTPAGWYDSGNGTADKLKDLNYAQRSGTIGSELGFARYAYEMGRRKVIVLKVTYGFQSLAQSTSQFVPFDWNVNSVNKSYARLKTEYGLLTDYLKSQGSKYTVDGFFWMQGETDTLQQSYAASYQQNLTNLFNAVRNDFQLHPAAHIVAGKVSLNRCVEDSYPTTYDYCGFPYAGGLEPLALAPIPFAHPMHGARQRTVRNAIQAVADSDQNETVKIDTVETVDLPRGNDWIHLTSASQIELGRRFINMYKLPLRFDSDPETLYSADDYDGDGRLNSAEDTGNLSCGVISGNGGIKANNGNLGDDDCDNDGYPNYLDRIDGLGSGL